MTRMNNQALYIFIAALTIVLLYYLAPILTPFMLGALLAYLTDPLVKRLEKRRFPHLLSVIIVFMLLILFFLTIVLMLLPLIQNQVELLIQLLPTIIATLQNTIMPYLKQFASLSAIQSSVTASIPKVGAVLSTILSSGHTVIEWMVNLVLTPIVTFYLLRDWDKVRNGIKNLLPEKYKSTILKLAHEYDEVLGAFFRGQLLIMLALCLIYGIGLTIAGLNIGFMLGVIGGLLSIVPYLGSLFVLVSSSIAALVQFHDWQPLIWVWLVFLIGQGVEGYILTPYLVGERIGLHPVAVIFAIMAGGALFGFFGVLLALPVAALLMVLFRHARRKHHTSMQPAAE